MITIIAKNLSNKKTSVSIEESCTCASLCDVFRSTLDIPETSDIKLIYSGKILNPELTITEYGIKNNDVIIYMVTKKKPVIVQEYNQDVKSEIITGTENTSNMISDISLPIVSSRMPLPIIPPPAIAIPDRQRQLPELNTIIEEESLFSLRSAVINMAMERIVGDKQLLMNVLESSPEFQRLVRSQNGLMISLIIHHPEFLTTEIFKDMMGSPDSHDDEEEDNENAHITNLSPDSIPSPNSPQSPHPQPMRLVNREKKMVLLYLDEVEEVT